MSETELRIKFDEESGAWVEAPEPYMTLEIETEEDWEMLQKMIKFWHEHHTGEK